MSDLTTNAEKMMMMVGSLSSSSSSSSLQRRSKSSIIDYSKYLPEDVWIEIFSRLPLNFIFKFRLINLPKGREDNDDLYSRCLGKSEGFICYCQIQRRQMTLSVWELEEDYSNGGWVWHLVHNYIELNDILAAEKTGRCKGIEGIIGMVLRPLAFNPVDRSVVILNCHTSIFAYNIQTRRSELLRQTSDHLFRMWVLPFVLTPKPTTLPPSFWSTDT